MAKRAGGYRARYGENDKPLLLLAAACTLMPPQMERLGQRAKSIAPILSIDWRNRALPRFILNNSNRMIRDDFARDRKHQIISQSRFSRFTLIARCFARSLFDICA